MIDLHLHFDGSLPVKTVWNQAKKQNIKLGVQDIEALKEKLTVSQDCQNLDEYLEKFELPLRVMQTMEGIIECMEDLIKELEEEGILYAEIRFAPQLHCQRGLTQEQVVKGAIAGLNNGCSNRNFKGQLILCCMRGDCNQGANLETVKLAKEYLNNGVCGCDLAGAEGLFKTKEFEPLFQEAKALGVPFTIHAGEADGPESIKAAIEFGAKRLGHGVRCVEDPSLVAQLIEEKITLECCPISNVHTKAVSSMEEHPLLPLLRQGMCVTINTDNRTVSHTTIEREIRELKKACPMTQDELFLLYNHAIDGAFLEEAEKRKLRDKIFQ